ncbi:hypothetical protein [Gorillibacterium sp. sgz5001074]|uniref:hypothetical protein n=1 Tax=Gorillibacterium sp. sgz5001074 TaxID=3446695 RepID=UPI003F68020C
MSSYEEFLSEKEDIDAYIAQGYSITALKEDLDGTEVRFVRGGTEPGQMVLLLLNPDARKYVTALIRGEAS